MWSDAFATRRDGTTLTQPAMHLCYDEDFVEAVVLLCASGRWRSISSLQISRFNRERERLYDICDPDDRNAAFFKLHLEWFREWGLEKLLTGPLQEFPLLSSALSVLAFRKARGKDDDGAELYVNEAGTRTGVLAMRPERLARGLNLVPFLRHELAHLHDMVDPAFGYRPELAGLCDSLGSQRLARERYRLLWDVSIDGRLSQVGRQTIATRDERWLAFTCAFPFWNEPRQQQIFDALWTNSSPSHRCLEELVCDPRQLQNASGPQAGAPCPLCGFPTFAWGDAASLAHTMVTAIQSEFPFWAPEQGICARCHAIYRHQARAGRDTSHRVPLYMKAPGEAGERVPTRTVTLT